MENTPSRRDRWLALGLLLALLALAYLLLIHPALTAPLNAVDQRIDGLHERESRARALLAQAPEIQKRLQSASAEGSGFLAEGTAELAVAGLVRQLETVVAEASPGNRSCAITNRTPMAQPATREKYGRITVMVRLRCGMPELTQVLYSLENGLPVLFVNNFNVLADPYSITSGSGEGSAGSGGLDVSFELYGYLRPSAAAQPAAGEDIDAN
ncbi:MAG: type II secretion system protein M [Xanthomonadaceae bacterium]|jgi:general secretion pathway protein M|nr:type II secretion system protein M [Xanthomonadaceae bacterium]